MKYKVFISLLLSLLLFSCDKEEEIYTPVYPQKIYAVYHEGEEPYPDLPVLYLDHMFYLKKRAPLFFRLPVTISCRSGAINLFKIRMSRRLIFRLG